MEIYPINGHSTLLFKKCWMLWLYVSIFTFLTQPVTCDSYHAKRFFTGARNTPLPEGIHQSLGADPYTERVLIWTCPANRSVSNVSVTAFGGAWIIKPELRKLYLSKNMFWVQRVVLKELKPSDEYEYTLANYRIKFYTWSKYRSAGSFLFYSSLEDSMGNHSPAHRELMYELSTGKYAAVVNLGSLTCQKQSIHLFLKNLQDIAARVPYLTTPGKSEIKDNFNMYTQLFSMPNVTWPMDRLWYSFDIRHAHIISFATEVYFQSNYSMVNEQIKWLEKDLIDANSLEFRHLKGRPWIIAFSHRSLYCSGDQECIHDSANFQKIENLLHKYGVDLIVTSQQNFYERTHPVYHEQATFGTYNNPIAPVYISTAAFTCRKDLITNIRHIRNPNLNVPGWSAKRKYMLGKSTYGKLYIKNATHLSWREASSEDHHIIDEFWLVQQHHGPFNIPRHSHPVMIGFFVTFGLVCVIIVVLFLTRKKIKNYMEAKRADKDRSYVFLEEKSIEL